MNIKVSAVKQTNFLITFYTVALVMLLSLAFFSTPAVAANGVNADSNGLSIEGYDPVAYFTMSKAVKGKKEFTIDYKGNKWAFSSDAHKQTFLSDPDAYLPQYGGYCAFAAGKNAIADVDPQAWTIDSNKLYLNYSHTVKEIWLEDKSANIVRADKNWPELVKKVL